MNQILYVKNRKNMNTLIIILCVILILCIIFLSTIFSIMNINNTKILSGIQISSIDVSGLSKEDATLKIEKEFMLMDTPENIDILVNNLKYTIPVKDLGVTIDYNNMVNNAYNIGRDKNFISNNFAILQTYLVGQNIPCICNIDEEMFADLVTKLKTDISESSIDDSYVIDNEYLVITRGKDGISLNEEKLKESIKNCYINKDFSQITATVEQTTAKHIDMDALYNEVTKAPVNASTVTENNVISFKEHVDGITFNLEEAKQIFSNSTESIVKIPLIITKPEITSDSLVTNMFKDTLSTFSSNYKESEKNRSVNVKLAAKKINGIILMPGQEFSYNTVVGERTYANGFRTATIYTSKGHEPGMGGGICQVSSTLYNSALLANLEITERKNHMYSVGYVPLGQDATVVYGSIDFKFKNNRTTPIKLSTTCGGGKLTVDVLGTKSENDYEVKIKNVTNSTKKYSTTTIKDSSLASGKRVTIQSGQYGYTVSTYKILSKNGKEVSNELIHKSIYNPLNATVKVGTKKVTQAPVVEPPVIAPTPSETPTPVVPDPIVPDPALPPGWDVPENPLS